MLHRPDLDEVYKRRLPVYEDLSVLTIDTDGRRPDAIAREVLAELARLPTLPPDSSSVFVTPVGGTYYAHVGPGLTGHVELAAARSPRGRARHDHRGGRGRRRRGAGRRGLRRRGHRRPSHRPARHPGVEDIRLAPSTWPTRSPITPFTAATW